MKASKIKIGHHYICSLPVYVYYEVGNTQEYYSFVNNYTKGEEGNWSIENFLVQVINFFNENEILIRFTSKKHKNIKPRTCNIQHIRREANLKEILLKEYIPQKTYKF